MPHRHLFVALLLVASAGTFATPARSATKVRVIRIHYVAHNHVRRTAYVALPRWYRRGNAPTIPLIISPHGRGLTGASNIRNWRNLPAIGSFAVVSPDGQGRRLGRYSWGYRGQIDDLARMPRIVTRALPWLHVDRWQIYAFGGSMGGQEALLLAARYPHLLAGVAAFDSVVDLALQYRSLPRVRCNMRCRSRWASPLGTSLQALVRHEVGGSPVAARRSYATRSPLAYARRLASSCVAVQLWWSARDRTVIRQRWQSALLFRRLRRLNPSLPLYGFKGTWPHGGEMHTRTFLPVALSMFALLPARPVPARNVVAFQPSASGACSR